jgi:hypothetical protein
VTHLENERRTHQTERVRAIQESFYGFLQDEVINPVGEFM